ncbi:MAG: DinB family protein, partial [Chitinophagales bacterium]
LRGTLPHIESLVINKTEEELTNKIEGAWSVKEHIGHLYDLEELWYDRFEDFLTGKEILRAADLSNTKTHEADHNKKTIHDLQQQFSSARNKLIDKVKDIDEATASITSLHPRLKTPMRLIDSLFFVAEHDDHHVAKIRELLL